MPWYIGVPICLPFVALIIAMLWVMVRGGDGY